MAMRLPLRVSYSIACLAADMWCIISTKDRRVVAANIRRILDGKAPDDQVTKMTKSVFRNFAKYLVDFFRFSRIDADYIKKFVKVDGLDNLNDALSKGKGAILLSAHIGNWELGGAVLASMGYPTSAVVLTHQDKKINDFFNRQRLMGKMRPIEMGISLKACYNILKSNKLLALLGDRDFTKNGIATEFFGNKALIPKGPSAFSYRIGSAIVPTFMLREQGDTFRLVFEEPIYPDTNDREDTASLALTKAFVSVMEDYVKRYPTQWYVFKDIWNNDEEDLRPDTIL